MNRNQFYNKNMKTFEEKYWKFISARLLRARMNKED